MSEPRHLPVGRVSLLAIIVAGCSSSPSILDPVSRDAATIGRLWWVLLTVAGVVFAVVLFLLVGSVIRSRRDEPTASSSGRFGVRLVTWAGLIGPVLILIAVFTISTLDLRSLARPDDAEMEILVTGEQWWWNVEYSGHAVVTANEIHVPVGTEVRFVLRSGDVIHSFWAPQAGPKRDMIPGRTTDLVLSFDRAGTYRGICSEFCGLQHAGMQFLIIAEEPDVFDEWLTRQSAPAKSGSVDTIRGRELFLSGSCVGCHTIRGVSEVGSKGPDLTHLASRQTIGAGVIDLNHENLVAWVDDPSQLKPGVLMPPSGLSDDEVNDLVAYLETLE